jgi:hypothetical protein
MLACEGRGFMEGRDELATYKITLKKVKGKRLSVVRCQLSVVKMKNNGQLTTDNGQLFSFRLN